MITLKKIYQRLYEFYGPQGWWPLSKNKLKTNHYNGPPKNNKDKFEIMVGSILTQNTTWKNVEKAIYNLNKEKIFDIKKIKEIEISKLSQTIKPSGYYNMKAQKLKNLSNFILENKYNLTREKLLSINGIGNETADSILLYALQKPYFIIDSYTKRIISRIMGINFETYQEWQNFFMQNLKKDVNLFQEYHALLVQHAKVKCIKKPVCNGCIFKKTCNY